MHLEPLSPDRSDIALKGTDDEIGCHVLSIIEASQARNRKGGLTGALVVTGGVFVQVLEGSIDAIESTFERICRDLRHRRVDLLEFSASDRRAFGEWSMAHVAPTGELETLCANLDNVQWARTNAPTAAAVVRMMRSVLAAA